MTDCKCFVIGRRFSADDDLSGSDEWRSLWSRRCGFATLSQLIRVVAVFFSPYGDSRSTFPARDNDTTARRHYLVARNRKVQKVHARHCR